MKPAGKKSKGLGLSQSLLTGLIAFKSDYGFVVHRSDGEMLGAPQVGCISGIVKVPIDLIVRLSNRFSSSFIIKISLLRLRLVQYYARYLADTLSTARTFILDWCSSRALIANKVKGF